MKSKWILAGILVLAVLLALAVGLSLAQGPGPEGEPHYQGDVSITGIVSSKISYQGVLKENGQPVNGTRTITFTLYSDDACSTEVDSIVKSSVSITNGLFSVELGVSQSDFNGQALWLGVEVNGTQIGCQEILPAPYALSLKPGALISQTASLIDTLDVRNYADEWCWVWQGHYICYPPGDAIHGYSKYGHGVEGETDTGTGVYAQAITGTAVYAESTSGTAVMGIGYDQGGVFTATHTGAGVFGAGWYGVLGQATSAFGAGVKGEGNLLSYGVWARNTENIALYADSGSDSGSTAAYIRGDMTVTGSKSGYVVDFAQSADTAPLELGDVVVVVGFADPIIGGIPVILVKKADAANSTGVVGVVDRAVTVESVQLPASLDKEAVTQSESPRGAMAPHIRYEEKMATSGEYVSIVTLGAFKAIKVDASYGAIHPGDLLVSSPNPGYAMRADNPAPGTIIGKALGSLESGTGTIPVLVTLH